MTRLRTYCSAAALGLLLACLALAQFESRASTWAPSAAASVDAQVPRRPEPAYLGLRLVEHDGWGVAVTVSELDGPAFRAGLRAGDQVLGLAGQVTETFEQLRAALAEHAAGERVQLVYRRGSSLRVIELELGARPLPSNSSAHSHDAARLRAVLDFLALQPGQSVADIGFGGGFLTLGLAASGIAGLHIQAVEIDLERVRALRARGLANVSCVQSKPDDVCLPADSLDIAVLHDVASHVVHAARPGFYASLARALKPDGVLVVFGPHGQAEALLEELASFGFAVLNPGALQRLTPEQLDRRLKDGIRFAARARDGDE